jgi:hypothetical protein
MADHRKLRSSSVATISLLLLALAVSPAVAPVVTFFLLTSSPGDPSQYRNLALSPFALLTFHGMLGYGLAFAACAVLGLPLSLAARASPSLSRKWVWVVIGALGGGGLAALLPFSWAAILTGTTAGGLTALTFRLIVGPSLRVDQHDRMSSFLNSKLP